MHVLALLSAVQGATATATAGLQAQLPASLLACTVLASQDPVSSTNQA